MTKQPEPAKPRSNQIPKCSKAIERPPDKEKPAPVGDRDGPKFERTASQFEHPQTTKNVALAQALTGRPLAVASRMGGTCHTVRVHYVGGAIEHRGLFSSAENAATAARELNRCFLLEGSAS